MNETSPMSSPAEKRTASRHPTLLRGQIHHLDTTADCTISNLSTTGACLRVDVPSEAIPNRFALLVKNEGSYEKCRVIWRSATEIGVKFE